MNFERYLAQMGLDRQDTTNNESFPERHGADLGELSLADSDTEDAKGSGSPSSAAAAPKRPPRARSESPDGYEMRGRYWEAAKILNLDLEEARRPPEVWDYIYDSVCLPARGGAPKTSRIRRLGAMPIHRAWRRRCGKPEPNLADAESTEAMMLYERGEVLSIQGECSRCKKGEGVSRECVIFPSICGNMCSNCLYQGVGHECNIADPSAVYPRRRGVRGGGGDAAKQPAGTMKPRKSDYMIVLKSIEQMKQSSTSEPLKSTDSAARAKRIEEAALRVARTARQWGRGDGRGESPSK